MILKRQTFNRYIQVIGVMIRTLHGQSFFVRLYISNTFLSFKSIINI